MKKTCSALGVAMLCIVISLSALSSAYAESMPVSKTGVDSVRGPVTAAANSSKQYDSRFLEIQKLASRILTTLSLQRKERINTPEDLQIPDNLQFLVSDNPDEPAELILIIRRKGNIISQGVIALLKNNKIYLPASELANIIKFKTTLDIQQGIFEGFFYDQENSFYIDALNNVYELKGIKNSLPSNTAILSDFGNGLGELYIDSEFLNKLWLLKLEFHFSDMSLSINTPKNLPNELILERGKKRKIRGGKKDFKTTGLTYLPNNYKLFSLPYLNITAKSAYNSSREKTTSSIYFRGKNDLFGAQADYNFSFINDEDSFRLDDNRFLLTKKSDYPGGLPLGIKKLELGDIILSPPTKVLSFAEGRGVRVSTLSEERLKEFDETIVSGTATPGWEVEVYNGRNLVGFDIVADDGSYSVSEIPLYYGLNKIKTILYGPEGQKEEKIEDISVSNKMLQPGKTVYELSAVERNKDILPLSEKSKDQEGSFLGEIYVARGINEHISSYATLTNLEFKDDRKTYLTLGSDLSLLNGSGKLELYKDLGGGHAFNTKLVTKYKDINLNLDTTFFSDFESQRAGSGKNRRTFTGSLRAKKQFQLNSSNFSLDAGLIRTHSKDGSKDTSVQTAQSAFYRFENGKGPFGIRTLGFGNSNNILYENGDHRNTSGQVNLRAQLNRNWDLRSYLNYDVSPEFKANDVRLNIAYRDYNRFSGNFDVTRDIDNSITEVGLNASYRFDKLRSGLQLSYDSEGDYNASITTSTSLSPDSKDGLYKLSSSKPSGFTSVSAKVFIDKNLNGVFDDLDSPFEGASLFVGNRLIGPSDSNGQIATEKIRGSRLVPVKLNRKTIPNPYIVEVDNGYFTSLRPNSEVVLNVPVIETGVIDGFIKFSNGSVAPNLRVQLIDNDHNVVNEVTTLFDGFYNFDFVRPGKYSVRLDPSYKFSVPPVGIQVTSENLFLYGTDLTIMEQAKEVRVSALAEEEERGIVPTSHSSQTVGTELPAPSTLSNRFPVAVNHVWTGELIDKGRLILLLSGPADYEIEVDNAADHIEFKFKNAIWDTTNSWGSSHMPHIYSFIADISITNEPILKLHMKDNSYISSHFIERIDGGYKLTINFENDN